MPDKLRQTSARAILAFAGSLAACDPAPPPFPPESPAVEIASVTYLCSSMGLESLLVIDREGRASTLHNGRPCDFATWKARVLTEGPIHSQDRLAPHHEWLEHRYGPET